MRQHLGSRVRPLDVAWVIFSIAMFSLMAASPAEATIPYHFVYVSFSLVYGFRVWSRRTTAITLLALAAASGALFVRDYAAHRVPLSELSEIPLMTLIVAGTAWHALRSASSHRKVQELAQLESSRVERQQAFLRDAAHAIRTPVTIARGHVELLMMERSDPQLDADAAEVLHQLDRLHHLARRLLAIEALQTTPRGASTYAPIDVGMLVTELGRRWSNSVRRAWVVEVAAGQYAAIERRRLEDALDALVENALRFTGSHDTVRISCRPDGAATVIEVADSGPGVPVPERQLVFGRFYHRHPPGEEPGTGLGLALVAAVAEAFSGSVTVTDAPESGALFRLRLPRIAVPAGPASSATASATTRAAASPVAALSASGASGAADTTGGTVRAAGSVTTQG